MSENKVLLREDILVMEAAELRILIAEKVFKATVITKARQQPGDEIQYLLCGYMPELKPLNGKRWQYADWRYSEEEAWNDCPDYPNSISAAMEVEHKVGAKDIWSKVAYVEYLRLVQGWNSKYVGSEIMFALIHATAEQRCKAALLAVMEGESI